MKNVTKKIFPFLVFPFFFLLSPATFAQITPDTTLGSESSIVTPNLVINKLPSNRIDGGAIRDTNLFHSFQDFNISVGRGGYFTNPDGVTNILSRVTGTNPSNILGTIGVLGNANLFFLNPNGIVFGPNARLQVNGSFLGSSAHSVSFADGTSFSATNPQTAPLLTVSVPVGLGLGSNPGPITVQGTGHGLPFVNNFLPIPRSSNTTGLRVQPGKTLALLGGEVALNGGTLIAERGRVELGSMGGPGLVTVNPTAEGFTLGYAGVRGFRDIRLSQQALADVSGASAGSIQVQGRRVSLSDGSALLVQNWGTQPGGTISVYADELLELSGTAPNRQIRTILGSETLGSGSSGDITITTGRLSVQDGAVIGSRTFSAAASGNIKVNAAESVQANGFLPSDPNAISAISSGTLSVGKAGEVTVSTRRLSLLNGGVVAAVTVGRGQGGSVTVNAEATEVSGITPALSNSSINATNLGSGSAGNVTLNTRTLAIQAGGSVSTNSLGTGSAGSITVNASESVEVSGSPAELLSPSEISSSVSIANTVVRQGLGLPAVPSGTSGDVTINTPTLKVTEGAGVNVMNAGVGNAGTLRVNAGTVLLDSQGSLTAATASGEGGNIVLQAQNLQLRNNSAITATVEKDRGNGGNLTITTGTLVALENSDITANAFQGRGGNILIGTQGMFRSANSDITASSELGINGVVEVTTLSLDQQNALIAPASNLVTAEQVVAGSCLSRRNAEQGAFVVTGNGGLPENPYNNIPLPYELVQVQPVGSRELAVEYQGSSHSSPGANLPRSNIGATTAPATPPAWKLGNPIQPATNLVVTADGRTLLVDASTSGNTVANPQDLTCQLN